LASQPLWQVIWVSFVSDIAPPSFSIVKKYTVIRSSGTCSETDSGVSLPHILPDESIRMKGIWRKEKSSLSKK